MLKPPASGSVTIYVPGLDGRVEAPQSAPLAVSRVLARARQHPWDLEGYASRAAALFGLPASAGLAALARLGEGRAPDHRWWVRCDPVHLVVDRHRLLLLDNDSLRLGAEDAARLGARVAQVFAPDGGVLEVVAPTRWYLSLAAPEPLQVAEMAEVAGRDIHSFLPTGNAAYWRTRLNEAQMLLHEGLAGGHGGEAARGEANSVWLWGPGYAPAPTRAVFARVFADDVLIQGMARMVEAAVAPLPAGPTALDGGAATLAVWPTAQAPVQYGDSEAWANALETLVATWWEPLAHELRAGRLKQLAIVGDRGPFYTWEPGRWRRWFGRGTQ